MKEGWTCLWPARRILHEAGRFVNRHALGAHGTISDAESPRETRGVFGGLTLLRANLGLKCLKVRIKSAIRDAGETDHTLPGRTRGPRGQGRELPEPARRGRSGRARLAL